MDILINGDLWGLSMLPGPLAGYARKVELLARF